MNSLIHKQNYENIKSIIYRININKVDDYETNFNKILLAGKDVILDFMKGVHDDNCGLLF